MQQEKPAGATLRYAFVRTLPVMAGYLVLGIGFGIVLTSNGYSVLWALAMSLFIYAGSMQYVAIDLLTGGASLIATALMTLMVNARHLFYGLSMLERYRDAGRKKPYLIFALTDETYSLVCSPQLPEGVDEKTFYFLVSAFDQCYWVAGSVIGALLGQVLPFDSTGIDFAMTALFVVVVTQQWLETKDHLSALIGFAGSILCLAVFGPDGFIIPSMLLITLALLVRRRMRMRREGRE